MPYNLLLLPLPGFGACQEIDCSFTQQFRRSVYLLHRMGSSICLFEFPLPGKQFYQ